MGGERQSLGKLRHKGLATAGKGEGCFGMEKLRHRELAAFPLCLGHPPLACVVVLAEKAGWEGVGKCRVPKPSPAPRQPSLETAEPFTQS